MEVLGRIMRTSGGQAQVAIVRDTACGHSCTSCGACQNRELYIQAENPAQYPVGDMVYVEVPDKPPYKIAFVVYILPLLLILGLCVLFGTVFGVGTVWLGLATREGVQARLLQLHGNRERIRTLAALNAMHWVLETVEKEER